jgi:hypothetical protein
MCRSSHCGTAATAGRRLPFDKGHEKNWRCGQSSANPSPFANSLFHGNFQGILTFSAKQGIHSRYQGITSASRENCPRYIYAASSHPLNARIPRTTLDIGAEATALSLDTWHNLHPRPQGRLAKCLPLSRLAIGVAPVAFGLPGGLVLDNTGDAFGFSRFTCFNVGFCDSVCCCLTFGNLGLNALLLLVPCPFSRSAQFLPSLGCRHTFLLPCKPGWFSGFLCSAIILKTGSFCLSRCFAALGEVVVSDVFQICIRLKCRRIEDQAVRERFEMKAAVVRARSSASFARRASFNRAVFCWRARTIMSCSSTARVRARNCD